MEKLATVTITKTKEHLELDELYYKARKKFISGDPELIAEALEELSTLEKRCLAAGLK